MDQSLHNPEVYDFRQYDRIWQRVAPTLEPYPAAAAMTDGAPGEERLARQEGSLPGAERNPCCMGSAAMEMLGVLTGFVEEELEDRRQYMALAQKAPAWAKQRLREMAAEEEGHARRLMAVYYLITGECFRPRLSCDPVCVGAWCASLRERYHAEACGGLNYARAAEGTVDTCLQKLLEALSADEYRHASALLQMLERSLRR